MTVMAPRYSRSNTADPMYALPTIPGSLPRVDTRMNEANDSLLAPAA
jgi:hypothetical protein